MKDDLDRKTNDLFAQEKRPQRMHANSLKTYREEIEKLGQRARLIMNWFMLNGPATDRKCMQALGFSDMNSVRPRITELIDKGLLIECPVSARDSVTGKIVRIVAAG